MKQLDLAWLAGFLDGEGSVGITRSKTTFIPTLQLSTTCPRSAERVQDIFESIIGRVPSHTYEERDPSRHRDAIYLRVTGIKRMNAVAAAVLPYSVTKKRHWELVIEFMRIRLAASVIGDDGNIRRGGHFKLPYGAREQEIYDAIRALNKRGPGTGAHGTVNRYRGSTGSGE